MDLIAWLRTPEAIRERCSRILDRSLNGGGHFAIDLDRLPGVADLVARVTRTNYPDLAIPEHSRWGHFQAGGVDRLSVVDETLSSLSSRERARALIDLVVPSVFLDAGAGESWGYREPRTGTRHSRSEGLAVASLDLFLSGIFSADPAAPCRADGVTLLGLGEDDLARGFQVTADNPLLGLPGRLALLHGLGRATRSRPDLFGDEGRVGNLLDAMAPPDGGAVAASRVLGVVLDAFSSIFPGRESIDGEPLGDVWHHPDLDTGDRVSGLVPFHKLSQWLTYSLLRPLREAGHPVEDLDALTGLAEYRNGGLFLDLEVLRPRDERILQEAHDPSSPVILEWRALTLCLLDRLLPMMRDRLECPDLTLARMLEGGTWHAGRKVAAERRPDGSPPLAIRSDGTVF